MSDMMNLEDIMDTIRYTQDSHWFVDRFELSIEDMVTRFKDLIEEEQEELPYDLGMEYEPEEYDDR